MKLDHLLESSDAQDRAFNFKLIDKFMKRLGFVEYIHITHDGEDRPAKQEYRSYLYKDAIQFGKQTWSYKISVSIYYLWGDANEREGWYYTDGMLPNDHDAFPVLRTPFPKTKSPKIHMGASQIVHDVGYEKPEDLQQMLNDIRAAFTDYLALLQLKNT